MGLLAIAVSEDNRVLAGHVCSSESYVKHDMGIGSDWKHDKYNAVYGEGNWELVYIAPGEDLPDCLKEWKSNAKT